MDILIFMDYADQPGLRVYVGDCINPGPQIDTARVEGIWQKEKWKSVEEFLRAVAKEFA